MEFALILAVDDGSRPITKISFGQVARPEVSDIATLGLSLAESKQFLLSFSMRSLSASLGQRRSSVGTAKSVV